MFRALFMTNRHLCALLALGMLCAPAVEAQQYLITTIAGSSAKGYAGDSGPASAAQLNLPQGVAVDAKGTVYIADTANHVIRMVQNGTITTVAGNGTSGYTGDGSAATKAELNNPSSVAVDSSGNLYIADSGNNVIRKVSGGNISTFAGSTQSSSNGPGYGGDGGPASGASFSAPVAVMLDSTGNLYIADAGNQLIREVTGGNINSVVGTGSTATKLNHPTGVAIDAAGNLYIADSSNRRVYKYATDGTLSTMAGNGAAAFAGDNGPGTSASLNNPSGVAVDGAGNVYIADRFNSRIRKVSPAGIITTIAGNGRTNYTGDGGIGTLASLNFPNAVAVDAAGNVYIADTTNNVIRMLQPQTPTITSGVTNVASGAPVVSAGALATVKGTNFAASAVTPNPPQTTVGGISVNVNGVLAPILFVNGTQVNFQVPWETTGATATVTVSAGGNAGATVTVPLTPAGPGLFVDATSVAQVQNSDSSPNSDSNPAAVSSTIQALVTGTGPVTPSIANGAVASDDPVMLTSQLGATIGSEQAAVQSAVMSPSLVGVAVFSIMVPADLATGDYPLVIAIGDETSNAGTISVTQ
jgi:uncharacterized protein (TIGR03437 family)